MQVLAFNCDGWTQRGRHLCRRVENHERHGQSSRQAIEQVALDDDFLAPAALTLQFPYYKVRKKEAQHVYSNPHQQRTNHDPRQRSK